MVTITCTKEQLELIDTAVEFTSRFICGQLSESIMPNAAKKQYHATFGKGSEDEFRQWIEKRNKMNSLFNEIKELWWGLSPNSNKGVGYDDDADNLFDMHCVIRHELYKSKSDEDKEILRHTLSAHPATQFGKESLIKVKI